jgi:hypothetical protein
MQLDKKRLPTHSQKVREQKERELDLDFDGDGLTEREERQYGLNPLSPDSDSDGRYDGQEVEQGNNPRSYSPEPPAVERGSEKEKLREAYLHHVQMLLKASDLSYRALYNQIAGDRWLGRSLDEGVMAAELEAGGSLEAAKCLLAQSPYVQWQLSEGQWEREAAIGYVGELTAQFQPDRKLEEQLSE